MLEHPHRARNHFLPLVAAVGPTHNACRLPLLNFRQPLFLNAMSFVEHRDAATFPIHPVSIWCLCHDGRMFVLV